MRKVWAGSGWSIRAGCERRAPLPLLASVQYAPIYKLTCAKLATAIAMCASHSATVVGSAHEKRAAFRERGIFLR